MGLIQNPKIPDADCTLAICSLLQAHYQYVPTLPGNALYLAIFVLLLALQLGFSIRYRTWGFLGGMFGGLMLEILGYVGRVQLHSKPFIDPPFLMQLVTLTIGPAFLAASIYLYLARLIVATGPSLSYFRPRTYTILYISCDSISLLLQAAGGALASSATTASADQTGINIMIAGLGCQVASLTLFLSLCGEFAFRVARNLSAMDPAFAALRATFRFRAFTAALRVATLAIFARSVFRVAELSQGFHGALANQEATFMVLEGGMIVVAVGALTIFHPGITFGGRWADAGWTLRGEKKIATDAEAAAEVAGRGRWSRRNVFGRRGEAQLRREKDVDVDVEASEEGIGAPPYESTMAFGDAAGRI
ncbi:hypothetical protein B0A49_06892 [Cryomyces minteri]|uniref:Uncharacterized protein n=1 Tax=Cryomyces minteri TaxID=331657 RepID=A0A4U0WRI7_9PEZI|nr:hypothetical protein B0A49_06892 [Cryomyces minteri]